MIKQIINGKSVGTINASVSTADFTTLSAVLAGKSVNWKKESEGGTATNVANPNFIRFSCGKKGLSGTQSVAVTLPHMKPTKKLADIRTAVQGIFDVGYESTTKCEYVNGVGSSSKGA